MKLVNTLMIDLNNVGEDYVTFQAQLPDIIHETTQGICALFKWNDDSNRINECYNLYSIMFQDIPFHHYPSFWQFLFEGVFGRMLSYREVQAIYEIYLGIYERKIKAYPDFLELISRCIKLNLRVGLVSNGNGERIYRFLEKYNLVDSFGTIVVSGLGPVSKPDPKMFKLALVNLNSRPIKSVYIGDRPNVDISGANQLGIWSVRIIRGAMRDLHPASESEVPDFEVNDLKDVLDLPVLDFEEKIDSVVIPCGGKGTRMGDVTLAIQKCMLPVKGIPILSRLVSILRDSGIRNFHFVVDYRKEDVRLYFGDGSKMGVKVFYHEAEGNSTGQKIFSLLQVLPEMFLYCHGDILFDPTLVNLVLKKAYKNGLRTTFAITKRPIAETHPVFYIRNGRVLGISRHPTESTDVNFFYSIGFGLINKKQIPVSGESEERVEMTTEQLFNPISENIAIFEYDQQWFHLESPNDIAKFDQFSSGDFT
jgi:HAD superfamily hydrolase (TIGR01549 family)